MKVTWMLVDLNSFFASCEQQDNPSLRGKPIAVVPMMAENTSALAASYEAKKFGVRTGTKVFEARKMCPEIQFVSSSHRKYVHFHHQIIAAVEKECHVEKVLSIDEMVCKLIGSEQEISHAVQIAKRVKQSIIERVGVCMTSSVGLGPNIMIAKIASDMQKPNGLVVIPKEEILEKIGPLDVGVISGVGRNMRAHLHAKGFFTVSDLLNVSEFELQKVWGSVLGMRLAKELRGEDFRRPENETKAFSHEHVLPPNLRTPVGAFQILQKLLFKGGARVREARRKAQGLSFSIRYLDGTKLEGSVKFQPNDDTFFFVRQLEKMVVIPPSKKPIKVGIIFFELTTERVHQFSFFDSPKNEKLNLALDAINAKHGPNSIVTAGYLEVVGEAKSRISFNHIPDLNQDYE